MCLEAIPGLSICSLLQNTVLWGSGHHVPKETTGTIHGMIIGHGGEQPSTQLLPPEICDEEACLWG